MKRTAFTLVELLVAVSIIVLLISLLLPALRSARHAARTATCLSQHRQLAVGMWSYSLSNQGYFPMSWRVVTSAKISAGLLEKKYSPTADEGHMWWSYLIKFAGLPNSKVIYCTEKATSDSTYDGNPRTLGGSQPRTSTAQDIWPNGAYHGGVHKGAIGMRHSFGKSLQGYYTDPTKNHGPFPDRPYQKFDNLSTTYMLMDSVRRQGSMNWKGPQYIIDAQRDPYSDVGDFVSTGQSSVIEGDPAVHAAIRHGYRTNTSFFDGHAKTITAGEAWNLVKK
jgi:prepilin-type processing-associated H-X9-DG protein